MRSGITIQVRFRTGSSSILASRGLTVNPSVTPVGVYVLEYKVTDSESPAQSVSQAFLVRVGPAPGVSIGTLDSSLSAECYA